MTRLPNPGSDDGTWGDILNTYLEVSLAADGTLNSNVVGTAQITNNAVTNARLDSATQTTLASVAGKYTKPGSGIPSSDMTSAVQTSLGKADNAVPTSQLGVASGVATLDSGTHLTASQLPTSVGSVSLVGIGAPSSLTNGQLYFQLDSGGTFVIAEWIGTSGSPTQLLNTTDLATYGTLAARPTVSAAGDHAFYTATDQTGQPIYQVQSGAWVQVALGSGIPASTVTTKGDVLTATGSSTVVRRGVGTDGQVFAADSSTSDGLAWSSAFDATRGQNGMMCIPNFGFGPTTITPGANSWRAIRFFPTRKMTIIKIGFVVSTAATNNDSVDVGLYDSTGAKLISSGATAGKVNTGANAPQTISVTSTTLLAGHAYYAALAYGAIGGTAATFQGTTNGNQAISELFGTGVGACEVLNSSAGTLPSTISGPGSVAAAFVLAVLES